MPQKTFDKYKGLRQDIDYPDLREDYCHVLQNIDVDDPIGTMRVRAGSRDKYDDDSLAAYPFTNILSAFEYRFDKAGNTVLFVNDNGTLKTMADGGNPASLTLPVGATLESGFQNQFFGYRDHVLITAGNGATNYILWYGYVDRQASNNEGLFGNAEEENDYIFGKAQLICPHGMFSNVYNVVYLDGYYYVSFYLDRYIEKRDTNFKLIERRIASHNLTGKTAKQTLAVALGTDGTYLYIGYTDHTDATQIIVEKITPDGWKLEDYYNDTTPASDTWPVGLCSDGTHVYVLCRGEYNIYKLLCSDMSLVDSDNTDLADDAIDITCDSTASTGYFYILRTGEVNRRLKSDLTEAESYGGAADLQHCEYDQNNAVLLVSSYTGDGHVYRFTTPTTDLTNVTDYTYVDEPGAFVKEPGAIWSASIYVISDKYGGQFNWAAAAQFIYPGLLGLVHPEWEDGTGSLTAGTYFYKASIVDTDGQEYTLSDPIIIIFSTGSKKARVRVVVHTDYLNDFYRVKYINLYRAFNSDVDAEESETDYKFLVQIDINDSQWISDKTANELYYFDYDDNITEANISSVTFLESSGIGDHIKPRFLNAKYMAWIDGQLHYANYYLDGETLKNGIVRTYYDAPDAATVYDPYNFDPGDGDVIKNIVERYGRAIVFKNRKFGVFRDGIWETTFAPGISGDNGFFKKDEYIYYISNHGLHAFDGSRIIDLKMPVKTYFDAASSYANTAVFYFEHKGRLIFSIRNDRAFVFNLNYKTWTYYTSQYAFRGFFKNYENEYIGWNQTKFYKIMDYDYTGDNEEYDGSVGVQIAIDYESPLFFGSNKGDITFLDTHRHRLYKNSSNTITLTVYDYKTTGKSSVATQALGAPASGTDALVKTYFFDQIMGESFSFRINGNVSGGAFKYYGMTLEYREGRMLYR